MNRKSWGLYPKVKTETIDFKSLEELKNKIETETELIPYGNGRSYGDSALNKKIINMKEYNYFLDFDEDEGILHIQAGVLLSDIINHFVPRGWFLKITPGTKDITVGGAIASDVHGKNHHNEGCFSNSVKELEILLSNGKIKKCSKTKNKELFLATCGGMGLTGVILNAKIYLKKIQSKNINQITIKNNNLKEMFDSFEKYKTMPYSVAWIDCLSSGEDMGKGLLMVGDFASDGDLKYKEKRKINIPFFLPNIILNKITVKLFNFLYFNKVKEKITNSIVGIDSFFYPLDSIKNWNRIYGKNGFTQYQFILPKDKSYEGLTEILREISNSQKGSFLAVLKLYGEKNQNFLSFPIEGYSLALDFKIEEGTFELLDKLDKIVVKYQGRIYLTKDARMSKEVFEEGYEELNKFKQFKNKYDETNTFKSLQSKRLGIE